MYKPQQQQQLFDLQDNNGAAFDNGGTDPSCWLSHENEISRTDSSLSSSNVDPLLFNDLVQIVPLVQSLIVSKSFFSVWLLWGFFWGGGVGEGVVVIFLNFNSKI